MGTELEEIENARNRLINEGVDAVTDNHSGKVSDRKAVDNFIKSFGTYVDKNYTAFLPASLQESGYTGLLYGICNDDTNSFYAIESANIKYPVIGYIKNVNEEISENYPFIITRNGKELSCEKAGCHVSINFYDAQARLFSRNSGLLESDIMLKKCAVIIGCGSVGSLIALQLAKAGVGNFVLMDTDILEIHNICRHQCGISDLGKYKVNAVRDRIFNINPNANVTVFVKHVQDIPLDSLSAFISSDTIIIGTGDNRESSEYACDTLAIPNNIPFVTTCCWTRAYAGEVFYWVPGKNLPCYKCCLGGLLELPESKKDHTHYISDRSQIDKIAFEPGISIDIDFITNIALKVILDLLNNDTENYTPRVINYLKQFTWICNTNDTKIGGEMAGIFSYPLQVTNNLYFEKQPDCPICKNTT